MVHVATGFNRAAPIGGPFGRRPVPTLQRSPLAWGGWTGSGMPSQGAAEVRTKYIIVDMYTKAVQGMPAEESVKAAHAELVKIYG